jgi:DNA-binding SARP family transcriptional activator
MSLETVANELYSAFAEHSAGARVVLLHAGSRYRTVLLSRLLNDPDIHSFYYAMGPDDTDTEAFLAGLTHDVAEQVPTFGAQVYRMGFDHENSDELAAVLAQDVAELSDDPFLLILDEFDQAPISDDLQQLLERLVEHLPEHCKLVISSRTLPRLSWIAMIAENKAVLLRDNELVTSNFYDAPVDAPARIQVYGLGPGHIVLDGDTIDTWEGHLPRLLLFFALDRPMVTRSEICQAFWPDLSTDQAVNVFHVTKRRLHKALEKIGQGVDILIHEDRYYRINPAVNIQYDVMDFVSALVAARVAPDKQKVAAWQRALELYQRPFLQGHHEEWIERRRAEFQAGHIEALTQMASIRRNDNRKEQALNLLLRAAADDPRRQDIHRQIMELYSELGRRSEAASHYQKLKQELSDNDRELEQETQRVYQEVMS